jgi:hypothetical protein
VGAGVGGGSGAGATCMDLVSVPDNALPPQSCWA